MIGKITLYGLVGALVAAGILAFNALTLRGNIDAANAELSATKSNLAAATAELDKAKAGFAAMYREAATCRGMISNREEPIPQFTL